MPCSGHRAALSPDPLRSGRRFPLSVIRSPLLALDTDCVSRIMSEAPGRLILNSPGRVRSRAAARMVLRVDLRIGFARRCAALLRAFFRALFCDRSASARYRVAHVPGPVISRVFAASLLWSNDLDETGVLWRGRYVAARLRETLRTRSG